MARHLQLLLLILTCFSVSAEMLVANSGLAMVQTDQVHDCGTEETRPAGETDADHELDVSGSPAVGPQRQQPALLATNGLAESALVDNGSGLRRHRWCGVDLN